jgi:hypothetical protein
MTGKQIEQPYGPGFLKLQDNTGQVVIEDAQIVFRNFQGEEGQFNRKGDRNFCVIIPSKDVVDQMIEDKWNVKQLKSRDGGETPGDYYLQVSVGFGHRPPNLFLISTKGRTRLTEDECDVLDWVDIAKADIIINPYNWLIKSTGATGVKAYLKSLVITLNEDYLELKYSDIPDANGPLAIEAGSQEAQVELDEDGNEVFVGELVD